ncbi:hypothetical protein CRENBAI_008413, partial [Crenichthys baileyi]
RPPEAALIELDFPHGLEKKARAASHAFLHARPRSESYPAALLPLKEPNVPLLGSHLPGIKDADISSRFTTRTPARHHTLFSLGPAKINATVSTISPSSSCFFFIPPKATSLSSRSNPHTSLLHSACHVS